MRARILDKRSGYLVAIGGIVEAHGGSIWFEDSAQGSGTRVHFTVPLGDDEEADEAVHSDA